jgi:hypothetical protein
VKVLEAEARRMCAKWNLDDPLAAHPRRDVLGLVDIRGKHGFLEDPKREHYSDECWFLAKLPDSQTGKSTSSQSPP